MSSSWVAVCSPSICLCCACRDAKENGEARSTGNVIQRGRGEYSESLHDLLPLSFAARLKTWIEQRVIPVRHRLALVISLASLRKLERFERVRLGLSKDGWDNVQTSQSPVISTRLGVPCC